VKIKLVLLLALVACYCPAAYAATVVNSASFSAAATGQSFDVTGANVVDWGYYTRRGTLVSSSSPDNTKAVSGIGAVTLTPGSVSDGTFGTGGLNSDPGSFTFDDGSTLASGTVDVGASFGAWAASETNGATIVFNDLGAGTHTVTFYVGHSANSGTTSRDLRMNYSLATTDGIFASSEDSGTVAGVLIHGTYTMNFTTDDASADLTLTLDSLSGEAGSGWVGGYIVETVPEPSSLALLALGGLCIARRRRD
jgi:hypothetical protein